MRGYQLLSRFGGDLLSHVLRRSTIGVSDLNGRVREGIGCLSGAMTTKPRKELNIRRCGACFPEGTTLHSALTVACPGGGCVPSLCFVHWSGLAVTGTDQANRAISTSQLKALPLLHLWPIDVVVFHGSQGRPCFEGGFTLRCLQRLSCPNIATQHYRWHDNWSTSGSFNPVLSY